MKRVFLLSLLLMTFLCACTIPLGEDKRVIITTPFKSDELARVGELSVYAYELNVLLADTAASYTEVLGDKILSHPIDGVTIGELTRNACFSNLLEIKTLCCMAEEYEIALSPDEENRTLFASEAYTSALSEDDKNTLGISDATGMTTMFREKLLADKVYSVLIKDVDTEVSDDEARTVTVEQIVIYKEGNPDASGQINDIYRRLTQGERFEALMNEYNEAENGTVKILTGEAESVVTDAAFSLNTGETSGVVEGSDAFMLLKCISAFDKEDTLANKERILATRKREAFSEVFDPYAAVLPRRLNEELYNEMSLDTDITISGTSFSQVYKSYFPEG